MKYNPQVIETDSDLIHLFKGVGKPDGEKGNFSFIEQLSA